MKSCAGDEGPDPRLEGATLDLAGPEPETLERGADLVAEIDGHADQLAAVDDQRPVQLCRFALDPDLGVSAGSDYLGEGLGVVGVGLVDLHLDRRLGAARTDADDG